jgi:hypothetical protein
MMSRDRMSVSIAPMRHELWQAPAIEVASAEETGTPDAGVSGEQDLLALPLAVATPGGPGPGDDDDDDDDEDGVGGGGGNIDPDDDEGYEDDDDEDDEDDEEPLRCVPVDG